MSVRRVERLRDISRRRQFALSIEVFPPKSTDRDQALFAMLERLVPYDPAFVSCTYGAGGSTRTRTIDLCGEIQQRYRTTATAHLTCVGSTREELEEWVDRLRSSGIVNIMALRGDPAAGDESFRPVAGGLAHANELVELIRDRHADQGIGVAAYPEVHPEAHDAATDLEHLKRKVAAGADAAFTQLFYINDHFLEFRDRCDAAGIGVPLVPGIMPITGFARIKRIAAMCGAVFPDDLAGRLEAAQDDPAAQFEIGVEHAVSQCRELVAAGVPGIHFYALNRSKACETILLALGRKPSTAESPR